MTLEEIGFQERDTVNKMPIENEGSPTNWTLRFKHGRLTILLLTESLTPFATLKAELLDTLRDRYPLGLPNPIQSAKKQLGQDEYIPIPDDIEDVALAVPVDIHDTEKGWKQLGMPGKDALGLKESPKTLGIKDGGVLAFRFRSEDEVDGLDLQGDNEDDEADEEEFVKRADARGEEQKFIVQWPSYDETYGEAEPEMEDDMDTDDK